MGCSLYFVAVGGSKALVAGRGHVTQQNRRRTQFLPVLFYGSLGLPSCTFHLSKCSLSFSLFVLSTSCSHYKMFGVRRALRLCQRVANVSVSRRGCVGAVPVDDIVNGLTEEQIQVSHTHPPLPHREPNLVKCHCFLFTSCWNF